MEIKVFRIEGQAMIEFCLVLSILLPLAFVGIQKLNILGEKHLEGQKTLFQNKVKKIERVSRSVDLEEFRLDIEPYQGGIKNTLNKEGRLFHFINELNEVQDALSYYKNEFKNRGWKMYEENGVFFFRKNGFHAFLWGEEKEVFLIAE